MFKLEPLPHREAIEYFRSKGFAALLQRFSHLDVFREEHARNWVVAKALRDDVSQAIRTEVERALVEGRTLKQFQQTLEPRLQELGWWGRQAMTDPQTGETSEVQLGSMRRLRTIFDTNMRTSHAAGHWAAIQRTKRSFPYLQYVQVERPTKRHDHTRFHDQIWPVDDPIWLRIYPPNGFFCGCHVIQQTEGWMKRKGRSVSPPPDLEERPWTNKRTGEVFLVPRGVHPGFDSNPGASWLDSTKSVETVTPDLDEGQRAIVKGVLEQIRLQRLTSGVESVVALGRDGQPLVSATAKVSAPHRITLPDTALPPGASILHSHITEASLSFADIRLMFDAAGHSVTAISPGGSIWRAVRGAELYRVPVMDFRTNASKSFAELGALDPMTSAIVYQHALMLYLERRGVMTYHFAMSERARQIMTLYAALLERLKP